MPPTPDVGALVEQARGGRPRAVARLISLVEDGAPQLRDVMTALAPYAGRAHVVGLTGAPGVGKSTVTSALVGRLRGEGLRVGVLAVDPTSPFSGGALLGDRVRMQDHATDPEVYIRSMATRGHLGGLASASVQAVRVLDVAGCDVVLVETVGVGQSEIQVAAEADTTVVLLAPGMGDAIQTFKAGILEIGDVFCVNKADRDGVEQTARELRHMISLAERRAPGDWRPPVVRTVAVKDEGVDELLEAIRKHRRWLDEDGRLTALRRRRTAAEIEAIALARLRRGLADVHGDRRLGVLADRVVAGDLDPYTAADELVAELTGASRAEGVRMIVAFSISPTGVGESVAEHVAAAVEVVRASGLPNHTDAMFTTVEGEWDEVMDVIHRAVDAVAARAPRVGLVLKADIRPNMRDTSSDKMRRLERHLSE